MSVGNNTHCVTVQGGQQYIVNAPNANAARSRVEASTGLKVVGITSGIRGTHLMNEQHHRTWL